MDLGHNRKSTEEQIALAIASTQQVAVEAGPGEWACLQCTFINNHNGESCAMCMCPRPLPNAEQIREQGSRNSIIVGGMYGNQPPPAASQPNKRGTSKTNNISASQHRRMTTEEQITLAIEQSIEAKSEEPAELFERKAVETFDMAQKEHDDAQHRRMTTEDQINRAIQMSSSEMADVDFPDATGDEKKDDSSNIPEETLTSEEQIAQQKAEDEAERRDLDLINAAIESAGTVHRRFTTEELIDQAISKTDDDENTQQNNFVFGEGGVQPQVDPDYIENYLQELFENPSKYENMFVPPPGLYFGPRERDLVQHFMKALNENKQEINRTRVSLNQERRANQDLKYEMEILSNKCVQLEQDLQQAQEALANSKTQTEELANRLDEKAVDVEDTFENAASKEREVHKREPSYAGIGALFQKQEGNLRAESQLTVSTEEDLEGDNKDQGHDPAKARQYQKDPQQESAGPAHGKQVSYGGISDMFAKGDGSANLGVSLTEKGTGATKVRAPSYGGIRELFEDDFDKERKQEREPSVSDMQENADKQEVKEREESLIAESLEEYIHASFDVVWKLLVEKVHHPEKYLPVEDVGVEHRDGKWMRHMFLIPMEIVITEEIKIDKEAFTIKFIDSNFPGLEIVNAVERTEDPNKQRVIFYKQNRNTGIKIRSARLQQMFLTDVHFLKVRAAKKMARAVHEREPSYGGVTQYAEQMAPAHGRDKSYGGVDELIATVDKTFRQSRHVSKMSYGGIRTMFDQNDSRRLMARLQEEVFRVMDMHPWSEITKGMVVQEVEDSLGFELESFHKRFIKITIMRIIDGKLKLECFAGESAKDQLVIAERKAGNIHNRDISYGGMQELFDEENEWKKKEGELDELFSKTQERELDRLYTQAQSASAEAIQDGGFKLKRKTSDREKEMVRKTRKHSRNVSYGGVRYMETSKEEEENAETGPEVVRVAGTVHSRNASNQYFTLGGFQDKGSTLETLGEEVALLRQQNMDLMQENEDLKNSKIQLVQTCSGEIERLRSLLRPSANS